VYNTRINTKINLSYSVGFVQRSPLCYTRTVSKSLNNFHTRSKLSLFPSRNVHDPQSDIFAIFRQFSPVGLLDSQSYRINPAKTQQYTLLHGSATYFNQTPSKHVKHDDDHVWSKHVCDAWNKTYCCIWLLYRWYSYAVKRVTYVFYASDMHFAVHSLSSLDY
jgi:hypothetical protein